MDWRDDRIGAAARGENPTVLHEHHTLLRAGITENLRALMRSDTVRVVTD